MQAKLIAAALLALAASPVAAADLEALSVAQLTAMHTICRQYRVENQCASRQAHRGLTPCTPAEWHQRYAAGFEGCAAVASALAARAASSADAQQNTVAKANAKAANWLNGMMGKKP